MLERASACLESRIWCSRKAEKQLRKTCRLLHSSFWNHGAGSLDLPLDTLFATSAPKFDQLPQTTEAVSSSKDVSTRSWTPFLDFLYPPQALQLLYQSPIVSIDTINPRRSPQGCRRYSSSPLRMAKLRISADQTPLDVLAPQVKAGSIPRRQGLLRQDGQRLGYAQNSAASISGGISQDSEAPGTAPGEADTSLSVRQRRRLAGNKGKSPARLHFEEALRTEANVKRIEAVYNSLSEDLRSSDGINRLLFLRLSKDPSPKAQFWALRLFEKIPVKSRNKAVYEAAVRLFLERKHSDGATKGLSLLQELQTRGVQSGIVPSLLMSYFIRRSKWSNALELFTNIRHQKEIGADKDAITNLFTGIESLAQLYDRIKELISHTRREADLIYERRSSYADLLSRLIAKYISKIQYGGDRNQFRKVCARTQRLLKLITHLDGVAYRVTDLFMRQLLTVRHPDDVHAYSRVVADTWISFSRLPKTVPSTAVLTGIITAWLGRRLHDPMYPEIIDGDPVSSGTIREAWEKHHGQLQDHVRMSLMIIHARKGEAGIVDELAEQHANNMGKGQSDPDFFWPTVYVHAVRRDSPAAKTAFDRIESEYGVKPSPRTYDMLMYAYSRANQLDAALASLQYRRDHNIALTRHGIGMLMTLYARSGNIEGPKLLLGFARDCGLDADTYMRNTLIVAHATAGNTELAVAELDRTISLHARKKVTGPLTLCFNSVMSMFAHRREYDKALTIYKQMKERNVPVDTETYGAMIIALCKRRHLDQAWQVLKDTMPQKGIPRTSLQFTSVMVGFISTQDYQQAIHVWNEMHKARIEPSVATRAAYIKATALLEDKERPIGSDDRSDPQPLDDTLGDLLDALNQDQRFDVRGEYGMRDVSSLQATTSLFDTVMTLHGRRRCFEVVGELFDKYKKNIAGKELDLDDLPMRMVTAMMSVFFQAGDYKEVQECWELLIGQATRLRMISLPDLRDIIARRQTTEPPRLMDSIMGAELPDSLFGKSPNHRKTIAAGKRFLLARPFQYYASSMLASREVSIETVSTVLRTALGLVREEFELDNQTWNMLVTKLCTTSPPRANIAFSLTERFLISGFDSWRYPRKVVSNNEVSQNKSRVAENLEYMNYPKRFVAPGDRVPYYDTFVHLAHALLGLRQREIYGAPDDEESTPARRKELFTQVGTISGLRGVRLRRFVM